MQTILSAGLLVSVAFLAWRIWLSGRRRRPKPGDAAPTFTLTDQSGHSRSLSDFQGRWLVLYFYPRDNTPGCTVQAGRFRDSAQTLQRLGADICGVSVDDGASHTAFARQCQLSFPLLADRGGAVARRYGSLVDLVFIRFARRNTFLIDPTGKVARVYAGASPSQNAGEVVAYLNALKG